MVCLNLMSYQLSQAFRDGRGANPSGQLLCLWLYFFRVCHMRGAYHE